MRTYPNPGAGLARALRLSGLVVSTLCVVSPAQAQERRYLFEVSAGAGYYSLDAANTALNGKLGAVGRIGVWLPYNLSVEAEGFLLSPEPKDPTAGAAKLTAGYGALLYNQFLGGNSWGYAKAGYGQTTYGGECSGARLCGTTSMLVAGIGTRIGLTPTLLVRAEAVLQQNSGTAVDRIPVIDTVDVSFTNYGINIGLSLMLGSKPVPDSDGDGILNNRDRCAGTPTGAQVDARGCPADTDGDGVANGVDRCPNTAVGALVDAVGCTHDSDNDNIADGIDKCPDTPAGVLVDSAGCPKDSDGDTIADGLDRCSDTPKGATVDALGCPGDEDADGVLDGLDRCPRTPAGANVNASGCVQGQTGRQPPAAPPAARPPTPRADTPPSAARPSAATGAAMVLENVTFGTGSARLQVGSYVELDSIAKVLIANPSLRVEIAAHTDASASPADDMHLSNLRAEAVRNYLVSRGVPYQQVVAQGYGGTQPRTPDTTPRGRAANRRIELRPLQQAP